MRKNRKPQRTEGRHHIRCHLRETHVRLWLRLTKCCCFKRTRKNSGNIGKLLTYRSVRMLLGQLHGSDNGSLPKRHLIIFQTKASSIDQTQRTKPIHNKQRANIGERTLNFRMIQIDLFCFWKNKHHGLYLKSISCMNKVAEWKTSVFVCGKYKSQNKRALINILICYPKIITIWYLKSTQIITYFEYFIIFQRKNILMHHTNAEQ